ncbi:MAG: GNAT family N-acetyltransferase [Pirellulaceae bacterium]|nr:GNAT family N-acetyltransferase [Pirellulaceae bacterium]
MNQPELLIRTYQSDDLPRLKDLTIEGFESVSIDRNIEDAFGEINGHDWRWRKVRHIDNDVEANSPGVFVAVLDGQVVGFITTRVDREAGTGLIPNLAVDSQQRQKGIGKKLLAQALDYFRGLELTHARIETLDQNEIGQRLYPWMGFQEVARQVHYCQKL